MNPVCRTTAPTLAEEVAAYACDFELIRIGMRAGCRRADPHEALERLRTRIGQALPAAHAELGELVVAHRRALGIFRELARRGEGGGSAALRQARSAHFAAMAALLVRLGAARGTRSA